MIRYGTCYGYASVILWKKVNRKFAIVKGIQAVRINFFLFILKVANIRCFILIKCSEQKARFKKYLIMS